MKTDEITISTGVTQKSVTTTHIEANTMLRGLNHPVRSYAQACLAYSQQTHNVRGLNRDVIVGHRMAVLLAVLPFGCASITAQQLEVGS